MADNSEPGPGPQRSDTEPRLAVLQEIATATKTALGEIRADLRGLAAGSNAEQTTLRSDLLAEMRDIRSDARAFRTEMQTQFDRLHARQGRHLRLLLLVAVVLAGALAFMVARGFHWLR
jgi:hypothetical protein